VASKSLRIHHPEMLRPWLGFQQRCFRWQLMTWTQILTSERTSTCRFAVIGIFVAKAA